MKTSEKILIVLILALLLGLGVWWALSIAYNSLAVGPEPERYKKAWCKEPDGVLEACAIRVAP